MRTVSILGHPVEIELRPGPARAGAMEPGALLAALEAMARRIDAADWAPEAASAFRSMRRILLFDTRVQVKGWRMTRSGCDEAGAVFYWRIAEFHARRDPEARAHVYLHDCWHVVQHRRDGGYAKDEAEQVAREVEALDHQIAAARSLGCADHDIAFLEAFRDDPLQIAARLRQGVRARAPRPAPVRS